MDEPRLSLKPLNPAFDTLHYSCSTLYSMLPVTPRANLQSRIRLLVSLKSILHLGTEASVRLLEVVSRDRSLGGGERAFKTKLGRNGLDTVGGVDVLHAGDLPAGC